MRGTTADETAARGYASWPKYALPLVFGVIWAIDAALKWLPGFKDSYVSTIQGTVTGQPGWLRWWFDFWIRFQQHDGTFFWALIATVETLIALALLTGFARKTTYIAAAVFSFLLWSVAEGFGGPYASGASDIGTPIIYLVVFAGLLALAYYAGTPRYSAAYYLEQKITWWWRIAELRRPAAATPAQQATATTGTVPAGAVPQPAEPKDGAPTGQPHAT